MLVAYTRCLVQNNGFCNSIIRRPYAMCCGSSKPPSHCPKKTPITPPPSCKQQIIPPNPCCPVYHHGKDTWKKYRYITFFVCFPIIIIQAIHAFSHDPPEKPASGCRQYEYMRIRTKRFPWGNGNESFFHNPHLNFLPEECGPPEHNPCDD